MKPDLSGCRAKLEWADAQIKTLDTQIHRFVSAKPYSVSEDADPKTHVRIYKLNLTSPIPEVIRVGMGQIIAAQRDCLDYLAVALAKKNGAVKTTDVYFPVAESHADFLGVRAQKKIARLSEADRAVIAALKPYAGGNEMLYALNFLNNKSKHREPIATFDGAVMNQLSIHAIPGTAGGYVRRVAIHGADNPTYPGVPYATFDADPNVQLNFAIQISFGEVERGFTPPVIETLNEFSRLVSSIVKLFD